MTTTPRDWLMRPEASPNSEPPLDSYLAATATGELSMPFCARCDRCLDIDQIRCEMCGTGRPAWRVVPLSGVVIAAIAMHRLEASLVLATSSYPVVEVQLESGHRIIASTTRATDRAFAGGEAVSLRMVRIGAHHVPRILIDRSEGRTA